ncbi:MAG: hypothetical protein SGI83_00980 [Bacteroidota bacterium]|nr:hypothetical protein [Bacteroidota bacterium]
MRKTLTVVVFVLITVVSKAQVYIQTTLPTVGLVQKNQLWNLVLVNGTTTAMEGKLDLILRDRQSGMELLTATTSRFTLAKGSLSVNVSNLNPIQYNYMAMDAGSSFNGLLPVGAYIACYSFTKLAGEKQEQLAEECVPFDIEPLSPPMLIFPVDSSELEAIPGQFTWTPPTPAGMINRLRYEILITEIMPGQKADEAMQSNMNFYNRADVTNNFMTYPASLPAFEKEKWYGWQIVAKDDKNYAGKSEVWVFKIKRESELEKIIKGTPYIKMKTDAPELGIAPNGILKLSYFNRGTDSTAKITLSDLSNGEEHSRQVFVTQKIIPGENQLQINLKKVISLSEESTYKAEIISSSGERNSILFRIKFFEEK